MKTSNKRGRRRSGNCEKVLFFRCSDAEYDHVKAMAEEGDRTISQFVRHLLKEQLQLG